MISVADYLGSWRYTPDATVIVEHNAEVLLKKVNGLLAVAAENGVELPVNPKTSTHVSGEQYGGFRPLACPIGAANSSHKVGRGVDVYDPENALDKWIDDDRLAAFGLYREHPDDTLGWCHLTDRSPKSGNRTFKP